MTSENWPLKSYLPATANDYCFGLWQTYRFEIKITRPRKTKLGDYRYRPDRRSHVITVNNNLNPFAFLMVYLHEVAHCITCIDFGPRVRPHGTQWQRQMKHLITPLLGEKVFPEDLEVAVLEYLKAPAATTCTTVSLTHALRKYDPPTSLVPLDELPSGAEFSFNSKKYRKVNLRRTRVTCEDLSTSRTWLIPKLALVEPLTARG